MGRIFISAGHGGYDGKPTDAGTIASTTTEAREMIQLRDLVAAELRSRSVEVLAVPDDLNSRHTIKWVNARQRPGDRALELHTGTSSNPTLRGASVFYIASNVERKADAEQLLLALVQRVPQLPERGAKPDTATTTGSIPFCRRIVIPSLLMEVGSLTNPDDRYLIQNRRRDIAAGIADGLAVWIGGGNPPAPQPADTYRACNINLNGQLYGEEGAIVNGNAYIPIDLADSLGVALSQAPQIRRVSHRNIVYIRAIELREFNISVSWDAATGTVALRSILNLCRRQLDRLIGPGNTTELQLMMFLKANSETALLQFPDIAKLYREEGIIEGINYDIAFCQMCLETNFLSFGGSLKPAQNNFGGLGGIGTGASGASFPSARIGVRAHIQHLKAYATKEPLVQEVVAPRFRFLTRGIAPTVEHLSGRWSADLQYGKKIMALLRRLYEEAGLL
jgi:hypothetical protein